jgi:hypothetical protein
MPRNVQSVLFDGARYNEVHARNWLALHGFKAAGKVHKTSHYLRFRQYEPTKWERYITKTLPNHPGIKLIVAVHGPPR